MKKNHHNLGDWEMRWYEESMVCLGKVQSEGLRHALCEYIGYLLQEKRRVSFLLSSSQISNVFSIVLEELEFNKTKIDLCELNLL